MIRFALLTLAVAAALALPAAAAPPAVTAQSGAAQTGAPATAGANRGKPAAARTAPASKEESAPTWNELSPGQQSALGPLAASWKTLSEAHKRKWIALSQNYSRMSPQEQGLLRSRMTEWASLSPQQRTQARLNFAETKKVDSGDKKAAWEAYQALPPEEKRKLAAGATAVKPPPPPTAPALRPVPEQKQAKVPPRRSNPRAPGIAVAPSQLDHNTLLPQQGAAPSPQN